jgi:hypothetical protein
MKLARLFALLIFLSCFPNTAFSQKQKTVAVPPAPTVVRTTMRHQVARLGFAGTVSIVGAPEGSISIEGWGRNEVDVSAEIQLRANTEADLDLLARVNTFVVDEDTNHVRVLTTGTHDKEFMRLVAKKFPKTLLGLPWKIDYRIRMPLVADLEINAGRGPISIAGVEGNVRVSATESVVDLKLTGGTLSATVAIGKISLAIPAKSWRGVGGELRLAAGEISLEMPAGFSGDINADVLRSGKIENSYEGLEPRRKSDAAGPNQLRASVGAGGSTFQLTVGDGVIYIRKQTADSRQ